MRLLLVEDDAPLRERLRSGLRQAGFAVDVAADGLEAESCGVAEPYDAVVLDLGLPGKSGLDVLRGWRAEGNQVPVLVLTARDTWSERVDGLKAGADDYLGKPFHLEELVARLNARLDEDRQVAVRADGQVVPLTGTEFRLLRYLMHHPGRVLSKSRLSEHVYELDEDRDSNVIEVYVNRLRQKLGKDLIRTRRGQGYVFGEGD